jgi:hypothetical protein
MFSEIHILLKLITELPLPPNLTFYQIFKDFLPAFALVVAATYYYINATNTIKQRKAQLLMNLHTQFRDKDFLDRWTEKFYHWEWKDFDDYLEKYGPSTNINAFASYTSTCAFFEGIGVLVKNKLVELELVEELMYSPICMMWEKTEEITKGFREHYDSPDFWEWYEYLYDELQKLRKRRQQTQKIYRGL